MPPVKRSYRVIVIGGGVAGISAAHHLACRGVKDVLVLESRGRLGGRVHTVTHEGAPLELGAQWIQGACPSNSMFNLANSLSLLGEEIQRLNGSSGSQEDLLRWPNTFGYIYSSSSSSAAQGGGGGGRPLSEEATKHVYEIFNAVREEAKTFQSRGEKEGTRQQQQQQQQQQRRTTNYQRVLKDKTRLTTFYNSRVRKALESLRRDNNNDSGNNTVNGGTLNVSNSSWQGQVADEVEDALCGGFLNALSLIAGEDPEQCRLELMGASNDLPGGDVVVPDGVVGILESLANFLPEGSVRLNRKVVLIDWSLLSRDPRVMDKVMVECEGPADKAGRHLVEEYYADFVISTLPLGVMKRFHQQIFYPGLDQQKVRAMQTIGCGHIAKLFLEWLHPWWAPGEGGLTLAWSAEEVRTRVLPRDWFTFIGNFAEVEGQPKVLVCWIAGSGARVVDQLEDEEVLDRITAVLHQFTGDVGISRPSRLVRDSWSTDPHSLCSLTFPLLITEEVDFDTLASPLPSAADPRLLFAGEATVSKYFSTMHGARLSGMREAERVLERMTTVDKVGKELGKISKAAAAAENYAAGGSLNRKRENA